VLLGGSSVGWAPLTRNTLAAFALTLAFESTPIRPLAWMPAVLWLGVVMLFLEPLAGIPLLGDLIVISPEADLADLAVATAMLVAAMARFTAFGGGTPSLRPSRLQRRAGPARLWARGKTHAVRRPPPPPALWERCDRPCHGSAPMGSASRPAGLLTPIGDGGPRRGSDLAADGMGGSQIGSPNLTDCSTVKRAD
jgi:hypothetical protein